MKTIAIQLFIDSDNIVQFIGIEVGNEKHFTSDFSYYGNALRIGISPKTNIDTDENLANLQNDMMESNLFQINKINVNLSEISDTVAVPAMTLKQVYTESDLFQTFKFY